jgi:hypothetical protein
MEYRSGATLLGLPFVHVATAYQAPNGSFHRGIAKGWIAVGDISFGVLVSVGGLAFGTGLVFGGLSFGLFSLGGLCIGALLALGGLAVGYLAAGGGAIAWKAALGGLAVARDYAIGGAAFARHANDAAARQFLEEDLILGFAQLVMDHSQWFVVLAALPALVALYRRMRRREEGPQR